MDEKIKNTFIEVLESLIPLHKFCGLKVLEVSEGYVKMKFPYKPELIGDPRSMRLHGGFISVAADACGGAAAMTQMKSEKDDVSTADMRIDYLRPGKPEALIAVGKITHKTTRTIFTEMQILQESTPESPIAVGRGVYVIKRKS